MSSIFRDKPRSPFDDVNRSSAVGTNVGDIVCLRIERIALARRFVMARALADHADPAVQWEIFIDLDRQGTPVGAGLQAPTTASSYATTAPDPANHEHQIPAGGFTHRLLRSVQWAEFERAARRFAIVDGLGNIAASSAVGGVFDQEDRLVDTQPLLDGGGPGSPLEKGAIDDLVMLLGTDAVPRRRGPAPRTDLELAKLASRYVDLELDGKKPIFSLSRELDLKPSTVRGRVYLARERGLLSEAPGSTNGSTRSGRAGGQLTPKAVALLEANE